MSHGGIFAKPWSLGSWKGGDYVVAESETIPIQSSRLLSWSSMNPKGRWRREMQFRP